MNYKLFKNWVIIGGVEYGIDVNGNMIPYGDITNEDIIYVLNKNMWQEINDKIRYCDFESRENALLVEYQNLYLKLKNKSDIFNLSKVAIFTEDKSAKYIVKYNGISGVVRVTCDFNSMKILISNCDIYMCIMMKKVYKVQETENEIIIVFNSGKEIKIIKRKSDVNVI